jgi:vanillate O-demethylase ferredoxin subunit
MNPAPGVAPGWLALRVAQHWRAASSIAALELVDPAGRDLPAFEAGAFIDVHTPAGPRAYSLCGSPGDRRRYVILVQREPRVRGGSAWLHDGVKAGDVLRLRPPRNEFPLAPHAVHSVLIAGGVGIAPLCAMAEALWHRAAPFELHYSCHSPERAAWRQELASSPYAPRVNFHWSESRGHLHVAGLLARTSPAGDVYVCGPPPLIEAAAAAFAATGRQPSKFHFESFTR